MVTPHEVVPAERNRLREEAEQAPSDVADCMKCARGNGIAKVPYSKETFRRVPAQPLSMVRGQPSFVDLQHCQTRAFARAGSNRAVNSNLLG